MTNHSLVPLAEALDALAAGATPRTASEQIAIRDATGCVLAADVRAPRETPSDNIALRAGYALLAADTFDASPMSPAALPLTPPLLQAGDALPSGTDSVLPAYSVRTSAGQHEAVATAFAWQGVRRRGEDASKGEVLLGRGSVLSPARREVLGALGVTSVQVCRPRVAVASGQPWSVTLECLVAAWGGLVVSGDEAPALLITGSCGLQTKLDTAIAVHPGLGEVYVRAHKDQPPTVGLPAQTDVAMALAYVLIQPMLDRVSGRTDRRPTLELPIETKISVSAGISNVVLLRQQADTWRVLSAGDITLSAFAAADALAMLPPGSEGLQAGARLAAQLIAGFL